MSSESDDLHILSSLLIKERSPEREEKVKSILASGLNLQEKIRQINEIDKPVSEAEPLVQESKKSETQIPDTEVSGKSEPEIPVEEAAEGYLSRPKKRKKQKEKDLESAFTIDAVSSEAAAETRENLGVIHHNRKMLKPLIKRNGFFRYYFSERRKIRKFAFDTGVVTFRMFGTGLVLNRIILDSFQEEIQAVSTALTKALKPVLEQGWLYLEKRDYNLAAMLFKLCREVSTVSFDQFSEKSINNIDRIAGVELLFLILHYEPEDIRELLYAVDTVFNKDPSKKDLQKDTSVNIHKLLDRDLMRPSLYNIIIGLNILKTRSCLELKDLCRPSLKMIDIHDFDCPPKVRDRIDEYLRKLEKGIQPFLEQEKEVYRMEAFIPTAKDGTVDDTILRSFYNSTLNSKKFTFDNNKDNIVKLILNLGYSFIEAFRNILSETIKVDNGDLIRLFSQQIFGQDLLRMEYNLGKLDKIQTLLPKLQTSRFIFIKKALTGAIESEADAVRVIDEISSTLVFIGKRLAHILRNSLPGDHGSDNEITFFSFDEKTYPIPRENSKIQSDGYLNGATIREALYTIASICYQTGALVQHGEIAELLEKKKKIHDEIRYRTGHYKRLAHEIVYRAFAERYDLS